MNALIDAGCFAGHDLASGLATRVEDLIAELDRFGVGRALVGSYRAIYQDLRGGCEEAVRWARAHPDRLEPLAVLHPCYYGEPPDRLVGWLRDELGVRALGLFTQPAYQSVQFDSPAVRALGEVAARRGMILMAGIANEVELAAVMRAWGDLTAPVLVRWMAGHRYRLLAAECAAAARCPNLHFDVGNVTSTGALEMLVKRIGADRLYFASGSGHNIAAAAHAVLRDANLAPADRAAISAGTVARLFGWEAPAARPAPAAASFERLRSEPKVDVHWHLDHWNMGEPALEPDEQRAVFDRFAYRHVIASSILALNYDLAAGNAGLATWFERDPRVRGLIVVNPRDAAGSAREVQRWAAERRFVGVKTIQDAAGLTLDDPLYEPILKLAADHDLTVVAHLPGMDRVAPRFPSVRFMATHGNWGRTRNHAKVPNISFDFSTGHANRAETRLADFIAAVGPERVLYGSDGQLVTPAWSLAKLDELELPAAQRALILRDNAYRLFPRLSERG